MKHLKQIFQALLGVVALILTAIIAFGRLAWRTIRNWWKNRSKCLRRSIEAVFILVVAGFVIIVGAMIYDANYGRDYYDRRISDDVVLRSFADNRWRLYNEEAEEYTTGRIDWISSDKESSSLGVYALPNKRGYVDVYTGRIVIDAEANNYRKAWVFSEGLAAVMKDGKIGFINAENEVVIPFQFEYSEDCRMYNFGYIFHNGYCAMTNGNGDLGLIDRDGNWVVEPAYDEIWAPHKSGYRVIVRDGRHGILNAECEVIYPAEYGYVNIVEDGFVLTKGGKQWQVDFEGDVVHPFLYDYIYDLSYSVGRDEYGDMEYALSDYVEYEIMNCYGIMNRITGEPITPAIYSDINMLSKNLFEVQEYDSYLWYLLDTKGNVVANN